MQPDERVFREHIAKGPFLSGVERGRWRLISIDWPHAIIAVSAAPRENGLAEYALRFELSDYPQSGPTAQPWNVEKNIPLESEKRPCGKSRVSLAFRDGPALYLPCDRKSIEGHENWRMQHPSMIWSPDGDITQYLRIVYELLNSRDYMGPRCPTVPA